MEKYSLTEEHRAQLKPHADQWIANAMSTRPMDDDERRAAVEAVKGLYAAADLAPPERIVFVPSPFVLRFAGGFAAGLWHMRKQQQTVEAALPLEVSVAGNVAEAAAAAVSGQAAVPSPPKLLPTPDAELVRSTVYWQFDEDVVEIAKQLGPQKFLLSCASSARRMWQGGNQWSGYAAFLSFFRHVAKLNLPAYEKYQHWEVLAKVAGPRIVHEKFCMISDRPEILTVDERNRPHADAGPFCRWRDGSSIYAINGVYAPWWVVERPDLLTVDLIHKQANQEIRRVMIEKFGWTRYIKASGARKIDERFNERDQQGELLVELPDGRHRFLVRDPSTGRQYSLGVPREVTTCQAAQDWLSHNLDRLCSHRS